MCHVEDYTPFFQLLKPAPFKVDPSTGEAMKSETIPYQDKEVTPAKVKSYVFEHLPDYTVNLDSWEEFLEFNGTDDSDINKVLIFSQKKKASALHKALSAEFRDRLRVGFVS